MPIMHSFIVLYGRSFEFLLGMLLEKRLQSILGYSFETRMHAVTKEDILRSEQRVLTASDLDDTKPTTARSRSSTSVVIEPIVVTVAEEDGASRSDKIGASTSSQLAGILYGLTGCCLFVTATFMIKQLEVDLLDALLIRFMVQIPLFAVFVIRRHYSFWIGSSKEKWLQIVLCVLSGAVFLGYFIGFRYLPLPDLTVLSFTRLLWTVVFGLLIYKEKPTAMILLAVCLTLFGVVFVTQPTFLFETAATEETSASAIVHSKTNTRLIGIALGLITGLLSAFTLLIFKQLITLKLKPSVLILQHSLVFFLCLILNQVYKCFLLNDTTLFNAVIFQWKYWLATIISLMQTLAVICGNRAVKREPPSIVTIISASEIIYAIILQNLFTKTRSNLWALLGSALVISSVLLIGIHKMWQEKKAAKATTGTNGQSH